MCLLFSLCPVKIATLQAQFDKTNGRKLTVGDVKTMIDATQVRELAECIARQFRPDRIILFGSYAYETPDENSDVDLLVTMRHAGRGVSEAVKIVNTIAPSFPVDLLVRTPEEIEKRLAWNDFFLRKSINEGTVLYEVSPR